MNEVYKVLILYEHKTRELETAVLVKRQLEKLGVDCEISQYYEGENFKPIHGYVDAIIVPHLYNSKSVVRTVARFGKPKLVVNLQYEQVLSEKWEKLGHHNPTGEAQKAFHVCWGSATTRRLLKAGVPSTNLLQIGAPHLDLINRVNDRVVDDFKSFFSSCFELDKNKEWVLFLSSFTYADIPAHRLQMNERITGTRLNDFVDIHTKSRSEILAWFEAALARNPDKIIIYRPHPDEHNLDVVCDLADKFSNFKLIMYGSAKQWIISCDRILSWYSTTVVESHFMRKSYNILRPYKLPDYFDSVLLRKASFVENKENFFDLLSATNDRKKFALTDNDVEQYYRNLASGNAVNDLSEFVVRSLRDGICTDFTMSRYQLFRAKVLSIAALLLCFLYRAQQRFRFLKVLRNIPAIGNWFREFDKQFLIDGELDLVGRDLQRYF